MKIIYLHYSYWGMKVTYILFLLAFIFIPLKVLAHHQQYSLALITQRASGDAFWGVVEGFMQKACDDLDMKLYIYYANSNRELMVESARDAIKKKVDVIVFPNFKRTAPEIIKLAEKHKTKVFLFNAGLSIHNQKKMGKPRGKYKYWIGQMLPDDEQAGYELANVLFDKAMDLRKEDKRIHVVGISGTVTEGPSILRAEGLKRAVSERQDVILHQIVNADWSEKKAFNMMIALKKRYPKVTVFWSASDVMAKGIARASKSLGLEEVVVTGGIDWAIEGLDGVRNKSMVASIGGQFSEAGFITVMLYDYLHGMDFASQGKQGTEYISMLQAISPNDIEKLYSSIKSGDWSQIDLTKLSKKLNGNLKAYNFNLNLLIGED